MPIKLEIHEQKRLPLLKQVEITADGIQHRLFRSIITLSVVVLAIAFLMNILTENAIAASCKRGVSRLVGEARALSDFTEFFGHSIDPRELRRRFVLAPPGSWQAGTLATWLELSPQAYEQLREQNQRAFAAFRWLEVDLKIGHRRAIFRSPNSEQVFHKLNEPAFRKSVEQKVEETAQLRLPNNFLEFATEYPAYEQRMTQLTARFNEKLEGLKKAMPEGLPARLAAAAGVNGTSAGLMAELKSQGIAVSGEELAALVEKAAQQALFMHLNDQISAAGQGLATRWKSKYSNEIFERDAAWRILADSPERSAWMSTALAALKVQPPFLEATEIQEAAGREIQAREVNETMTSLESEYGRSEGISPNVFWLIIVSFMVCVAGIANAMLVSVIERFREIATMKCLGALDSFIAVLFVLEAAFLGLVGALAGVLIGALIGVGRMLYGYGELTFQFFPAGDVLKAAGVSLFSGLLLAILAAIYPAYMASRMPPMEAMRVE